MVRFGTDRAKTLLQRVGFNDDMSIRNKMISKSIESAQTTVEGNNFDTRKALLQYDDVINQQREYIYDRRNEILDCVSIHDTILQTFKDFAHELVYSHIAPEGYLTELDYNEILEQLNNDILKKEMTFDEVKEQNEEELENYIYDRLEKEYNAKLKDIPTEIANEFEKAISLRVIDTHWMEHINTMDHLREGIGLRGYAQENPLTAYTTEGFALYEDMLNRIDRETAIYLLKAEIRQNIERKEVVKNASASGDKTKTRKSEPKRVQKIGRNDPCPCGSGKKYKQCCGK